MAAGVGATVGLMTTREKFDRLVDQFSEPSLKAEYARLLREREIDRQVVESYERTPQFEPDGWADLEEVHKSSRRAVLGRLDEETGGRARTLVGPKAAVRPRRGSAQVITGAPVVRARGGARR